MKQAIAKALQTIFETYPLLKTIVEHIANQRGTSFLVGGAVRDILLGTVRIKDLDIEVHNLSLADLQQILQTYGHVSIVGKSFGVLRLQDLDIDWSLPRTDSSGRKPEVIIDPYMGIKQACKRRDLTINAMAIDLITGELHDPFDGHTDLKNKTLRTPDPALFIQDPLRFYRVMQFCGRFEMEPNQQLNQLCSTMNLDSVSRERIEMEFEKLFLTSKQPSRGIRWIHAIGRLESLFPELGILTTVDQQPTWHPEGDVFEHTMQTLDGTARIDGYDKLHTLILMYAGLCHDMGKATTTQVVNGVLKSIGHDTAGVPIAKRFLKRITANQYLIESVCKLVRYHMMPIQFVTSGAKPPAYKRLALALAPQCSMQMLADLARADKQGRNPHSHIPLHTKLPELDIFLKKAETINVRYEPEKPILQGRDIADCIQPGPEMGIFLKRAYQIQIKRTIKDKQKLKELVLEDLLKP